MIFRGIILSIFLLSLNACNQSPIVTTQKTAVGWQLLVNGKPFFIKGICYSPTAIGESSHDNTRRNWLLVDDDNDQRNDYAYQTWVDTDRNNKQDKTEEAIGDFELMRRMGVNTLRIYHHLSLDPEIDQLNTNSSKINILPSVEALAKTKELMRELYTKYGIWVAMGDLLGSYTVSTGAVWEAGTDYTDPNQKARMLKSVKNMVETYKDEPYILLWVLGNENNLEITHTQANRQPVAYARFVNEAARLIKQLDPRRPVAICNGTTELLDYYAKYTPDVDIFGVNEYSHDGTLHNLWQRVAKVYDRPVMLTEFGPAFPRIIEGRLDEEEQARMHKLCWQDILKHREGWQMPGNAIGGFVFEWVDQWWPAWEPWVQNVEAANQGWNQEFLGLISLGDGSKGSLVRQLRKAYGVYEQMWKEN